MNTLYNTSYIGAIGYNSIYNDILNLSNSIIFYDNYNSNILNNNILNQSSYSSNYTNISSNKLQIDIKNLTNATWDINSNNPSSLIYKNSLNNTIIRSVVANKEIQFNNITSNCYTKIDSNGKLNVYHNCNIYPLFYDIGWWDVEGRLSETLQNDLTAKYDILNLQAVEGALLGQINDLYTTVGLLYTAIGGVATGSLVNELANILNSNSIFSSNAFVASNVNVLDVFGTTCNFGTVYFNSNVFFNSNTTFNGITTFNNIVNANFIKENGLYLSNIYVSSNALFNQLNYMNYTDIREYPPKLYDSVSSESTITFLGQSVIYQNITINNYTNGYGIGNYNIYSSTKYSGGYSKNLLFDYDINIYSAGGHFALNQYNNATGIYLGTKYIKNDYLGDFIILQLPNPIILQQFKFIARTTIEAKAPGEWKCYGSIDGLTFIEIPSASNPTRLSISSYISNANIYTQNVSTTNQYNYIGWCVNKLAGNDNILNFVELQIFGKEIYYTYIYASQFILNSNILYSSNYASNLNVNITNYVNTNIIYSSNYASNLNVNLTNYVNTNIIYSSNYVSNLNVNLTNYVNSNIIYSSNYVSNLNVNLTNYVNTNIIYNSNYASNLNVNLTNYVNSNILYSSNYTTITSNCFNNYLTKSYTPHKFGFYFITPLSNPITLNKTYYKYDIDIKQYTTSLPIGAGGSLMRKFRISTFLASGYVDFYQYSNEYSITMSWMLNAGTNGAHAGLNLCAFGFPYENLLLDKLDPSGQFLIRSTSIDYLSYLSDVANTKIYCIIEDLLN